MDLLAAGGRWVLLQLQPRGAHGLTGGGSGNGTTQNPYAFHGGIQDRASGLVKFGIRWYNPTTGTWTQQDTLDAPLDPHNGNRYVFAGGDPINNGDPTGLDLNNQLVGGLVGVIRGAACAASTAGVGAIAFVARGLVVGLAYTDTLNYLEYGETPTL